MMTSEVKELNIDDLPCRVFQRHIDEWGNQPRRRGKARLPQSARLVSRRGTGGVGIDPKTLVHGWRGLESRSHQLMKITHDVQAAHWQALKAASAASVAAGCNGDVWIPDDDGKHIRVFDGKRESCSSRPHAELVKECIGHPDMTGLILSGQDLVRMHRWEERENAWRRRYWTYHGAFMLAIEERLREFTDTQAQHYPGIGRIMPSCAFLFGNEDRRYLVTISREKYEFTWFGGTLFHDGSVRSL